MDTQNAGRQFRASLTNGGQKSGQRYRTVKKLSRFSSADAVEQLEARTMMSAAAPTTPGLLSITATSPASISLTWVSTSSAGSSFELLRAKGNGQFTPIAQINSAKTFSYTDKSVTPGTTYSYEIKAETTTKTASVGAAKVTTVTPLIAPSGLSANVSGSSIVLKWTDNDKTAGSYNVYRESDGVHYVLLTTLTGAATNTFKDTTVADGHAYSYEVQAQNTTTTSPFSNAASAVTALVAPSHLAVSVQSSNWLHLSWSDNDSSATGYAILRSTNGVSYSTIATVSSGSASSYDDKTVAPFTTYSYEVEATTAIASPASTSATATTPLAVPTWTGPIVIGQNSFQISWSDSDPSAKGYEILQSIGGKAYTQTAAIASGKTTSWTDTSFISDAQYSFEVEAVNGSATSAASTALIMTSPLFMVTGLSANASTGTSVKLTWTDNDPNATKYLILRSVDGSALNQLTTVTGGSTSSYTDNAVTSGQDYVYDVMAMSANSQSGMSSLGSVITPLNAPANLNASQGTTGVVLHWTDEDPSATGYIVLRSTDNVNFSKIASISGTTASTYTDTTASSAHTYYYQVQAINSMATSKASASATITTPLLAPSGLTATAAGTTVVLNWTDADSQATGYTVLRSTDGTNFTQLAVLNGGSNHNYNDTTATAGVKYYYQVQATATGFTSAMSNTANITMATPTTTTNTVSIALRYTDELVITSTGSDDSIAVSESGSTITILADGQTTTDPAPAAGVFVYTRGGADSINIAPSVTAATTVETVDTGVDSITSAGTNVTVWDDSTDIFTGTGTVHTVTSLAGGVSKATGASLPNPSDAGTTMKVTGSLWGTGPIAADLNQGEAGDCYFISSLAAFAGQNPAMLEQSAVDMGDGTYIVKFMNGQTPTYIRVSNSISTYGGGGYLYARPGSDGDLWGPILEKAYAYFRTGANTYASLNSGWMGSAYALFGVNSDAFFPSQMTATQLYNQLSADLAAGKEVTLGTSNAPQLVSGHAYTLISVSMVNGVAEYIVRNPWGVSGDSLENSQGYATLTFAQMQANFYDGCESD